MRIEPHENLYITLLDRHLFGSDRLAGSVPRREVPLEHVCAAERVRVVPVVIEAAGPPCEGADAGMPGIVVPTEESAAPPTEPGDAGFPAGQGVGNLLDVWA